MPTKKRTEQNRIERIISIITMDPIFILIDILCTMTKKSKYAAVRWKYQRQTEQEREKQLRNLT